MAAVADSGTCGANGDNVTWTFDDTGTLTISGKGDMCDYVGNNTPWLPVSKDIRFVVVDFGVNRIGNSAFSHSSELISAELPESVTAIGNYAFYDCGKLAKIEIPDSVASIGYAAFSGCASLKSVRFSGNIAVIGDNAFRKCDGLVSVGISGKDAEIGFQAFHECHNLKKAYIYDGVKTIADDAFGDCGNLTEILISNSVESIGEQAFHNCGSADVYYGGTETEWNAINKDANLTSENITIHYQFSDVSSRSYCSNPVAWAVCRGITNGTTDTTFSPNNTCTTANIITFLWRVNGCPLPSIANPFSDVPTGGGAYYETAAIWAYEKELISSRTFNGGSPCTRAAVMKYLWILAGRPESGRLPFEDVDPKADYAWAIAWAVESGVTNGTTDTTFSPDNTCTRGQIATFLYRHYT